MVYSDLLESDFRYIDKTPKIRENSFITVYYNLNDYKFIPLEILNTILEDKDEYDLDKYEGICTLSILKQGSYNNIRGGRNIFNCILNKNSFVYEKIHINKKDFYLSYTGSLYDENFNLLIGKVVTLDEVIKGTYNTQLLITSKVLSKKIKLFEHIRDYISDKNVLFYNEFKLDFYNNIHSLYNLNKSIIANKEEFMNSIKNEFE